MRAINHIRGRVALAGVLIGAAVFTVALAQPQSPSQTQPQTRPQAQAQPDARQQSDARRGTGGNEQPADPAATRERLQRRLEDSQRTGERLQDAIRRLDAGEAADKVLKDLAARDKGEAADAVLTPEERARIQKFMQTHMPRIYERFVQAEKESPDRAQNLLKRMRSRFRDLMELEPKDPKTFAVRLDEMRSGMYMLEASRELRALKEKHAPADAVAAAEAKVKDLATQNVDAHLKVKARELEKLGDRLEQLRQDLQKQTADREKMIQQRTRRLMNAADKADRSGKPADAK